jgi:ABC-type multidrug transport system fused ATPase/permease subunit
MADPWSEFPFDESQGFDATQREEVRQQLYSQLCKNDRETFVVVGRTAALWTSVILVALLACFVGVALLLYVKFRQQLHKVVASAKTAPATTTASTSAAKRKAAVVALVNTDDVDIESPSAADHPLSAGTFLANNETAIYCSDLCYYPSSSAAFPILKHVDVQICYGSLVAVMGPSGSGKVRAQHFGMPNMLRGTSKCLSLYCTRRHSSTLSRVVAISVNTSVTHPSPPFRLRISRLMTYDV